jgi:hypothetical protein
MAQPLRDTGFQEGIAGVRALADSIEVEKVLLHGRMEGETLEM